MKETINVTVIPAQAGTYLVYGDVADAENIIPMHYISEVLGWRAVSSGGRNEKIITEVVPITVDGCETAYEAVLRPDGVVDDVNLGQGFASISEWQKVKKAACDKRPLGLIFGTEPIPIIHGSLKNGNEG